MLVALAVAAEEADATGAATAGLDRRALAQPRTIPAGGAVGGRRAADGLGRRHRPLPARRREAVIDFVDRHREGEGPFDVVVAAHWEHTAAEYAEAGTTWLLQSRNAEPGWVDGLRPLIEHGPPRL